MLVYLDYNIIVSIHKNPFYLNKVKQLFKGNNIFFPYSSAHIQEIDNISGLETGKRKMDP
jgi:hypothetical protein